MVYHWQRNFNKAHRNYASLLRKVKTARDPYKAGKPLVASMRAYLREDPDYKAPVIEVRHQYGHRDTGCLICRVYPDNIVEMMATPAQLSHRGSSLSQQLHKVIPAVAFNFDNGRYKFVTYANLEDATGEYWWRRIRNAARGAQEYFQHLKLDLSAGKLVNPKDMTPVVDEEKRKQWLAGLKKFRLNLKARARIGALSAMRGEEGAKTYFEMDELKMFADAIMRGECDEQCTLRLIRCVGEWQVRRSGLTFDECVVRAFENMIKSNSRDLRSLAGVIDLVK